MSDEPDRQLERRIEKNAQRRKQKFSQRRRKRLEATPDEPALAPADQFLPWDKWADGRIHRLKRGKHYEGDIRAIQDEAELAAFEMKKGVRTLREQMGPKYEYLWVQFADHAIPNGAPCVCGGKTLVRLHKNFVRCERCGETSVLTG